MAAPGIKLTWNVKKEQINADAEGLMKRMKEVYDAIGALSSDESNYDSVVKVHFNLLLLYYS